MLDVWTPRKDPGWFVEQLDSHRLLIPEGSGDGAPVVLCGQSLDVLRNGSSDSREVQTALLLPLRSAEAGRFGLLAVAFRRRRRRVFWRVARDYQTIGAQAALALENLRLVEEARRAGVVGERQRLANEIHDTLAQGFHSIAINLDTAAHELPPVPEPVRRLLNLSRNTARESLAEARRRPGGGPAARMGPASGGPRPSLVARGDSTARGTLVPGKRHSGGSGPRRRSPPASAEG